MINSLKSRVLYFVVFITGGSVLIIEVLGVRILSPYFGNTLFSFSSVLSVILAALSLGYYAGGIIADRRPSESLFYKFILTSGLLLVVLYTLAQNWLETFGYTVSIVSGPLISSSLFFFGPALFLGMLSPLAIKIQTLKEGSQRIGQISGGIFFFSTLGSIAGSLATGFWLVPSFGISNIIYGVSILLVLIGIIGFVLTRNKNSILPMLAVIISAGLIIFSSLEKPQSKFPIVIKYEKDGIYERIKIYESFYNDRQVRLLEQDRSNSAAMFLDSDELVFDYTRYYSLYKVLNPKARQALALGGGAYSIPKALLASSPDLNVEVSEIEPRLYDLAKTYFNLQENPRLQNHVIDGRRFLVQTDKKYDLIFSDVYHSLYAIPTHFTTREFFKLALSRLNPEGVFMANIIGTLKPDEESFFLSELKTFRSIFPRSYIFAVQSKESKKFQNLILVGHNSDKILSWTEPEIVSQSDQAIANAHKQLVLIDNSTIEKYPILTDEYAPVDYLVAQGLKGLVR